MLQKDPETRLSVDDILTHAWLKCPKTITRLDKKLDRNSGIELDDSLERTMTNVTLNDDPVNFSIKEPPSKKRRIC